MFWFLSVQFLHLFLPFEKVISHLFLAITHPNVAAAVEVDDQVSFLPHAVVISSDAGQGIFCWRTSIVVRIDFSLIDQGQFGQDCRMPLHQVLQCVILCFLKGISAV